MKDIRFGLLAAVSRRTFYNVREWLNVVHEVGTILLARFGFLIRKLWARFCTTFLGIERFPYLLYSLNELIPF
jgi:hypothetical protein